MIKTVAVLGAGAVGSYVIANLECKLQDNLYIIAKEDRKEKLARDGIIVNNKKIKLNVKTAKEAKNVDLLIVAVKYLSLENSLEDIKEIVGDKTIVLSLLNGVDSEEIIEKAIGKGHLVYSLIKIASQRSENIIKYDETTTQGIFIGSTKENDFNNTKQVDDIVELFNGTNIKYTVRENIIRDIWLKFSLNISKNLPQAILSAGVGCYNDSIYMSYISSMLRLEVSNVAIKKGIDITDKNDPMGLTGKVSSKARFSTLQDLDNKRPTEIDMFSGTLIRLGKEYKVETPWNEFAYNMIKAMEEKNQGKFIYDKGLKII